MRLGGVLAQLLLLGGRRYHGLIVHHNAITKVLLGVVGGWVVLKRGSITPDWNVCDSCSW